jgi:hypothetical protein
MPHVPGVPEGSKPISEEEKQKIIARWEGQWDVQPLPPMAVKGYNKKFYIKYKTAHFDDENIYLSGGMHRETQVTKSTGSMASGLFTSAQVNGTTKTTVDAVNEGQCSKLIFFRSPDGR